MAPTQPLRLILASASFGRRALLERAGYSLTVQPADIDEPTEAIDGDIRHYVADVAWRKAAAVAPRFAEGLVLAADSVSWCDGRVIGKPTDEADARRIIATLAGRVHELWTGVCLWRRPDDWQLAWQERSLVQMKPFTGAELDAYVRSGRWRGCSGGYAVEEVNDPYVRVVAGSLSNVIGLPMESLRKSLTILTDDRHD